MVRAFPSFVASLCLIRATFAAKTCCWSKWGDATQCEGYTGSGGMCNTDWTHTCNANVDCPDDPSPTPAPPTPPAPKPTPPAGDVIGYWDTTWSPVGAPQGATLGIAFSGWNNPTNAMSESNAIKSKLVGEKWIDAGGGGLNGRWNTSWIQQWESLIKSGQLKDWAGIVLDVEECFETGLSKSFGELLHAAKSAGLGTMVTVSASAPYMCDDSEDLMKFFFASDDIDYLSPQTYGESGPPKFVETYNSKIKWTDWVGAKARFVPSLTKPQIADGDYELTKTYFKNLGIDAAGYVVWPTATVSAVGIFI